MLAAHEYVSSEVQTAGEAASPPAPRRKSQRRALLRIGAFALVATLLLVGFVGQRIALMHLTYQLDAQTARLRQLVQENEYLNLQVARARSLDRIEAIARGRLGMQSPGQRDVVVIPSGDNPPTAPISYPQVASAEQTSGGWLASLMDWANQRWPGNAAEAGRVLGR